LYAIMIYVGLTGNIASGKSQVSRLLAERGATIVDADVLAREAVEPGSQGYQRVVARWGQEVLAPDGRIDRAKLRHLVFGDRDELEALNAIVHPGITRLRRARLAEGRANGATVLVYVAPLLFERHIAREFDSIILVDAPRAVRLQRLVDQRGIPLEDAMNMIAAQMPAELKRARADFVIENDGTIEELERQVDDVWHQLTVPDARSSLAV
jgi:dephospho-CoA kinase